MSLIAALALICCQSDVFRNTDAVFRSIPSGPVPLMEVRNAGVPQFQLLPLSTNAFTNVVTVLEYIPIITPCPECGLANHHELRVARVECGYFVTATLIAGDQTNKVVVYRSPRTNFLSTNTVIRSVHRQQQPGWTVPPPISP